MSSDAIADLTKGDRRHELAAIGALIRSGAAKRRSIAEMVDEFGSAVRLLQLTENDRLFATPDASHDVVGVVKSDHLRRALSDVDRWLERGLDVRSVLDASYPVELREIFDRPPLIFVDGRWTAVPPAPAVAIVGARKASAEGLASAARFATVLSRAGFTILSGLAAGIDSAAHAAALEIRGRTAAVMGTGIDRVFPTENIPLAKRILDQGGALISQFFPEQPPTQWTFPLRNVVMSGLAQATIVIEASETSGARIQARVALQHGRTVFLLESLVRSHEWAAKFATDGAYGTRALVVQDPDEILDRMAAIDPLEQLSVA